MEKLKKLVLLTTLIVLTMLVLFEYTYSAPYRFFAEYQSVSIDTGGISTDEEKEILMNLSKEYETNIFFNQRHKGDKSEFILYSTMPIDLPNFPNIYSIMENKDFEQLESSNLYMHELFIERTPQLNELLTSLAESGMVVEEYDQPLGLYTVTKATISIILLTLLLNLIIILISFNNNLKGYGVQVLEGHSINKLVIMEIANDIKFLLISALIVAGLLLLLIRPELYVYSWLSKLILGYIVIYTILKLFIVKLFNFEKLKDYVKGYSSNAIVLNLLLGLKIITIVCLIVSIPVLIKLINHIDDLTEQMNAVSKYDDIVVSQMYSSSITSSDDSNDNMETSVTKYYDNTVDEFNGLIYYMDEYSGAINYNALAYIDILDDEGNVITEDDLSKTEETRLVVNPDGGFDNEYKIAPNQQFLKLNTYNYQDSKMISPNEIIYFPRDLENTKDADIVFPFSSTGYFLKVPGDDKYETLKPYIEDAGAESIIISTPGLTVHMEENLVLTIERTIGKLYSLIIMLITVMIIVLFSIVVYIRVNAKRIMIQTLEGIGYYQKLKKLYLVILVEFVVIVLLSLFTDINIIIGVICIMIELMATTLLSKYILRKNRVEYLKGDL